MIEAEVNDRGPYWLHLKGLKCLAEPGGHFEGMLSESEAYFVIIFYIYGPLVKKATFRFLKDYVLAVLSSKMSRHSPSNVLQDIMADNSIKKACFKNLNVAFLTNVP